MPRKRFSNMPNETCTPALPSAFSLPSQPARLGLGGDLTSKLRKIWEGYRHGNCKISRGAVIVISVCKVCGAEEREDTKAAAEGSVSDTILHLVCLADRQQYIGGTAADHLLP
ncbi:MULTISPECIES: hypothetical protein [Paenibacillus]|nr:MULTISPECIES: hypothetical protein [Paenibacillus]MEC0371184.1 hypothetical protein [Paenibacillus chibensis]